VDVLCQVHIEMRQTWSIELHAMKGKTAMSAVAVALCMNASTGSHKLIQPFESRRRQEVGYRTYTGQNEHAESSALARRANANVLNSTPATNLVSVSICSSPTQTRR
jgi:hypothetical protein